MIVCCPFLCKAAFPSCSFPPPGNRWPCFFFQCVLQLSPPFERVFPVGFSSPSQTEFLPPFLRSSFLRREYFFVFLLSMIFPRKTKTFPSFALPPSSQPFPPSFFTPPIMKGFFSLTSASPFFLVTRREGIFSFCCLLFFPFCTNYIDDLFFFFLPVKRVFRFIFLFWAGLFPFSFSFANHASYLIAFLVPLATEAGNSPFLPPLVAVSFPFHACGHRLSPSSGKFLLTI